MKSRPFRACEGLEPSSQGCTPGYPLQPRRGWPISRALPASVPTQLPLPLASSHPLHEPTGSPAPEGRSERSRRAKCRAFRHNQPQRGRFCRPSGARNPFGLLTHGSRHGLPFIRPTGLRRGRRLDPRNPRFMACEQVDFEQGAFHEPGQSAVARVGTGALTPPLSPRERESRMTCGDAPESQAYEPSRVVSANARPTLRNPRRRFSFSPREKAGMRSARYIPRYSVHGPMTCPIVENRDNP